MGRDFDERDYARKRAEMRQQSSWYKLKEGDNNFRILPTPPTEDVKTNFFEYAIHRDVGPKKQTVRCGINPVNGEGECWLCDVKIPSLKKKKLDQRAAALAPKGVVLIQVAKVDDDGKMTGPFLFTPAKTVADQLLASIFGSRKRSYVDPVKGYNLGLNRTGTGKNDTRYGIIEPDQDPSKVPSALIAKVKPFEELKEVPAYSQAKQSAAYLGQDVAEEEEERPKSKSRKADPEPEDEADEAEDSDELDEEESDEEIDEEETEDEEEDDEPVVKGKAGKSKPAAGKKRRAPEEEEETEEAEEDEEDEEDLPDEEEAEEEDEPEPPKPRAKTVAAKPAGKKPPVDEDDPEDEVDLDDIEEDEPESPKKPKPAAKPAAKVKPKTTRR